MNSRPQKQPGSRLEQILGFLDQDPANLPLLAEAAMIAFDAGEFALCQDLVGRHAAIQPLPSALKNLEALLAIAQSRFSDAVQILTQLRADGTDNPALRFNLAWAWAMTGGWEEALELLDDDSVQSSPRAPALKIQVLHHLGRLQDALDCGQQLAQRYPQDRALMGALASIAIDAEQAELATDYARRAGDDAEGQAALGILALSNQDVPGALAIFDNALQRAPDSPRALVGKGLSLLSTGNLAEGAQALDKGAERFSSHIGSWVAAGWAHLMLQDYAAARDRFERAMALDPNFAETHGGLAVLNIADGRPQDAARECDIALRLDRNSLGGALAKSLLLEQRGHPEIARKIVQTAMASPIGPQGQTLAQLLAGFGNGPAR